MSKITCQICNEQVHSIQLHLRDAHPTLTVADYKTMYPHAPLLSEMAQKRIDEAKGKTEETPATETTSAVTNVVVKMTPRDGAIRKPLADVFSLDKRLKATKNARGEDVMVSVLMPEPEFMTLVPDSDDLHVWDVELLKSILMGFELNIPIFVYGHAGTGKTTSIIQGSARTQRPLIRVQHTANTEEWHVLGQHMVRGNETVFDLGPLPYAMIHGLVYLADEYDFAHPSVTAVYQPVLEGNPLYIKEAPPELRLIRPHPNFRFAATGNTNGSGDDTGLYQGTQLGNSANYSRFGITERAEYMSAAQEQKIVQNRARITDDDAQKLVQWANDIRKAYGKEVSVTVGPRELINAATIGGLRADMKLGIKKAIINRWSPVDYSVGENLAQRYFG